MGLSTPSLTTIYERFADFRVGKGDRLTDWLQRPLTDGQLIYAANDVARLLQAKDQIVEQLEERGRLSWALDECEIQRVRLRGQRNPDEAWRRIKEARQLRGSARTVARSLAAWRERRAAALDIPVRYVLSDIALTGIAQRPPKDRRDLEKVRGFDRGTREEVVGEILGAVKAGMADENPVVDDVVPGGVEKDLRPAIALISAWVSQLARDLELDASILATRGDIEAFLRGDSNARLATGWREALAGSPVRSLLEGGAAVAFAGNGELVIEQRSRKPLS